MKRTSSPSQLREEEGVEHHGVILSIDVILKHERPNQALHGNRTTHQDFLGMQSGFVNLMSMLSAPETHVLSVNVPREVKVGFITKKVYSFCLMVEASDHGYVLHTNVYMSHGTEYDTI
jgi:hypothetical protein